MVVAGASGGNSIDGFGMRLRVRGSSVSKNPVSLKSPLAPRRQEIPSAGSAIEKTTVQPPLWRENAAIGAFIESLCGETRGTETGGSAAIFFGASVGFASACPRGVPLRKTLSTIWSE